jgi:tRNA (guanine-N7-)-methyltransferase
MSLHPSAKPGFVRHVVARMDRLRGEIPALLPETGDPLVFEIGCGHGHFLTRYAAEHPAQFCLGIDLLAKRLEKAERKREKAQLPNVRYCRAEAAEFLECLLPSIRFSEVFLLFPDPWPKKRHHKNRLMNPVFLGALARRMTAGGRLFFRTDHQEYFATAKDVVEHHADWRPCTDVLWPLDEATVFQRKAPSFQSLIAEVVAPTPFSAEPAA